MGKKKSVVLTALITIVIVVLCAIIAFPVFTIPGSNGVKKWNPTVLQYDLGTDFGGGYYTYYYPNGVMTEVDYEENLLSGDIEADDYVRYGNTDFYLSTDEDLKVVSEAEGENGAIEYVLNEDFQAAFNEAAKQVKSRLAKKGFTEYRVSIVDGVALRVEVPNSENMENIDAETNASQVLSLFANVGKLSFQKNGETVSELKEEGVDINDIIKSVSAKTKYEMSYLKMNFTSLGKDMLKTFKSESSSGNGSASTIDLVLENGTGVHKLLSIQSGHINDSNNVEIVPGTTEEGEIRYVETLSLLLNSLMADGEILIGESDVQFAFQDVNSQTDVYKFAPVYRSNALNMLFIAVGVTLLVLLVLAIVKMGGFGVVNLFTTLTYFVITTFCFAFITKGVLVVTMGTALMFLLGLALTNVFQARLYAAIKAEFALGKTVESSIKGGYKKTFWGMLDTYAVLLIGAVAALLGVAGLHMLAIQALICVLTGAFCNLLWGRALNVILMSASKNKYKFYRFVREDDDDE
ncbi:MAG: hypothetical protein IJY05_04850 [Clostridia bacterium]|nr:hypothetical protein [Clostridia bacterium]